MSKADSPTREMLRIEADDEKTHALLCALIDGEKSWEKRMEQNLNVDEQKLEYIKEWQEEVSEVYFADRE